MISQLKEK